MAYNHCKPSNSSIQGKALKVIEIGVVTMDQCRLKKKNCKVFGTYTVDDIIGITVNNNCQSL